MGRTVFGRYLANQRGLLGAARIVVHQYRAGHDAAMVGEHDCGRGAVDRQSGNGVVFASCDGRRNHMAGQRPPFSRVITGIAPRGLLQREQAVCVVDDGSPYTRCAEIDAEEGLREAQRGSAASSQARDVRRRSWS